MTNAANTTDTRPVAVGTCPACGFVLAADDHTGSRSCPGCGALVQLTWVVGKSSDMPCNDACQFATGPRCVCACGGANHCRGYIAVTMVPAWVRDRDAQRHAAKATRAEQRKQAAADRAARARDEQIAEYPELAKLLGDDYADAGIGFAGDMRRRLQAGQLLSPAQAAAAARMVREDAAARERDELRQQERDEALQAGVRVPAGRTEFSGEVVSARYQEPYVYGGCGSFKIVVRSDAGWRVWVTAPRTLVEAGSKRQERRTGTYDAAGGLLRAGDRNAVEGMRGMRVTMVAELRPSDDDQLFGFGKRPKLVQVDAEELV